MKLLRDKIGSVTYRSAILMEEGDYKLHPNKVKGLHVDYVFIPKCDVQYYTGELYQQLLADTSVAGIYFGQFVIYENNIQQNNSVSGL